MTDEEPARPGKRAAVPDGDAGEGAGRSEGPVESAGPPEGPVERRVISDPRTIRALAHPVRLALLEALGREGELTATRAAEILDESPGNMSWHLQTLAKYGYVEEAGGGKGRSRPWRIASVSNRFQTAAEDPAAEAAGGALESIFAEQAYARLREWWTRRAFYPYAWREAAFTSDSVAYLTAEEMSEIGEELAELFSRYRERVLNKDLRPAEAKPVKLIAFGHPIPPTPSGN
jgi:DNA-binding transcriptional ArsR family regulator